MSSSVRSVIVMWGSRSRRRAAMPETMGVAIEVPSIAS